MFKRQLTTLRQSGYKKGTVLIPLHSVQAKVFDNPDRCEVTPMKKILTPLILS